MNIPDFTGVAFDIREGIRLRQFNESDVDAIYETVKRNEDHLTEFMHWMTPDYSRAMTLEFIDRTISATSKSELLGFGIFRDADLVGSIGFTGFDFKVGKTEIGYWIDRAEQGKGIVSRSTKALIDYAFDGLGLNRIEIRCSTQNRRSAAIPERFGFKLEGHLRQCEIRNGKLHDFFIYGLLRSEWNAR